MFTLYAVPTTEIDEFAAATITAGVLVAANAITTAIERNFRILSSST
jgi:hypothetical protein